MKKGDRVICIYDKFPKSWGAPARKWGIVYPRRDEIYTVRDTIMFPAGGVLRPCVLLAEIRNPVVPWGNGEPPSEPAFSESRFVRMSQH